MTSHGDRQHQRTADVACSLSSAELHVRVREWCSLGAGALIGATLRDGAAVAAFARSAPVARRLEALIEAERGCCPFLDFRVHEEGEVITLEVRSRPTGD